MMRTRNLMRLLAVGFIFNLVIVTTPAVYAASKDLEASKRVIFEDDSTESMRDIYVRKDAEDKEYKQTLISNSEESVKLLREIRDLLKMLNEKE